MSSHLPQCGAKQAILGKIINLLLQNGLPEEFEGIPISADFRNMIQVDLILREEGVPDAEKTMAALSQLYPEIPADLEQAVRGLAWFFSRGGQETGENGKGPEGGPTPPRAFDYDQDANLIYAAFYATYGISLTTVEFLHWWEFLALFEGLPEDTLIKRVMYWRTANLSELPKEERKHVRKMRKLFALKEAPQEVLTAEEMEEKAKEDLARRYEQARRWKEERQLTKPCAGRDAIYGHS